MICAETLAANPDGSLPVAVTPTQPADLSTCAVVLVSGSELSAVTGISFPSPVDFGAAWSVGFTLVVGSYIVGWAVGTLLRFIRA